MIGPIGKAGFRDSVLAMRQFATAVIGWLFGYPLTWLVRRDRDLTVVIGRRGSVFADNSKYFFLHASENASGSKRVCFLTSDRDLAARIKEAGGAALPHPSWHSLYLVLRSGRLVMDMADWFDFGVYPLSRGAQLVQLWHGAPLKHIELDLYRDRLERLRGGLRQILALQKRVLGRYPTYDVVVSPSRAFVEHAFGQAFSARRFLATGYPRNDVLLGWPPPGRIAGALAWINVDRAAVEQVQAARAQGRRVALFVPTFRRNMASPFGQVVDPVRLSAFAERAGLLIVVKLHPFMHGRYRLDPLPNLIEYAPLGDVYPLMAQCDLLITDYSSIYLDYLLLDRPIVFFAHDLEDYVTRDRNLYFPYESVTAGTTCRTQDELEDALAAILYSGFRDSFADLRAALRAFTHDHVDAGSSARLLAALRQHDGQRDSTEA